MSSSVCTNYEEPARCLWTTTKSLEHTDIGDREALTGSLDPLKKWTKTGLDSEMCIRGNAYKTMDDENWEKQGVIGLLVTLLLCQNV